MIRVESLGEEHFQFDAGSQSLTGSRSGIVWRLGQSLRIEVEGVDRIRQRVDFRLVQSARKKPARRTFKAGKTTVKSGVRTLAQAGVDADTCGVPRQAKESSMVRDLLVIVVVGSLLGLGYNFLGIQTEDGWGLSWVAVDRVGELSEGPSVAAVEPAAAAPAPYMSDDPLAPAPTAQGRASRDSGRWPAGADPESTHSNSFSMPGRFLSSTRARTGSSREGHIRGAVSVPFNTMGMDPAALEQLDAGGKPIVTYCGGGTCEVSLSLAWEMIGVGHAPIAVYMGGFPEWGGGRFRDRNGCRGRRNEVFVEPDSDPPRRHRDRFCVCGGWPGEGWRPCGVCGSGAQLSDDADSA